MKNVSLIVAGGIGRRFLSSIPKQYTILHNKPVLRHSIEAFLSHPDIDGVLVVTHKDYLHLYEECIEGLNVLKHTIGAEDRQGSVRNGLQSLKTIKPKNVLIHDAVRPFVSHELISNVLDALENFKAVDVKNPIVDAIRDGEKIISNSNLYSVQTPQGFDYETIYRLHELYKDSGASDDISLAHRNNIEVGCVSGEVSNIKITHKNDIIYLEKCINSKSTLQRVGLGLDVHKIIHKKNSTIPICGVYIPCDFAIEAHSDGDVGLHAITEAILGSISEGNIGTHFPPSDMRWKDVSSEVFVSHANSLLRKKHGRIVNIDITVVCENPKIMPHAMAMRQNVAKILEIGAQQVSVKATTTELMGFLGRKEGIMAQAICTVIMN